MVVHIPGTLKGRRVWEVSTVTQHGYLNYDKHLKYMVYYSSWIWILPLTRLEILGSKKDDS